MNEVKKSYRVKISYKEHGVEKTAVFKKQAFNAADAAIDVLHQFKHIQLELKVSVKPE